MTTAMARLLTAVPEFKKRFLDLVETFDTDLGEHVIFVGFADFVTDIFGSVRSGLASATSMALVMKCLAFIEDLAASGSPADAEIVGIGFLDSLAPYDLDVLSDWFGPATLVIWEELESGDFVL
ncbi:MAG: DUF7674 family protein [Acidimicrobiales bacterium]